jgi:hypothetical protein
MFAVSTQFVESKTRGPGGIVNPPITLLDPYPNHLFQNNSDGTFSEAAPPRWGWDSHATMGIAYADYDNDGWVDMVLGSWDEEYRLFRNTAAEFEDNHWLKLRLVGAADINRDAVGTRVYLTDSAGRIQMQEVICGSGLGAGNDLALHFGLADASINLIRVVWPDSSESLLEDVPVNQIMRITYPSEFETIIFEELE